jgi:hypothetical protein
MVIDVIPVVKSQDHTYVRGVMLDRQQTTKFLDDLYCNGHGLITVLKNKYSLTEFDFEQLLTLYEEGENKVVYDFFMDLNQNITITDNKNTTITDDEDTYRFQFLNFLDSPNTNMSSINYVISYIGYSTCHACIDDDIYTGIRCYDIGVKDNILLNYLKSKEYFPPSTEIGMYCIISDI